MLLATPLDQGGRMVLAGNETPRVARILGALLFTVTLAVASACGQTEETNPAAPTTTQTATDATDAARGAPDTAATVTSEGGAFVDASSTPDACPDASAPAPDGGTCDWSRIQTSGLAKSLCIKVGVFCDAFQFSFSPAADGDPPIPAGFTCSVALGVKTCTYQSKAGTKLNIDAASLSAACEVTTLLPKAVVSCMVFD